MKRTAIRPELILVTGLSGSGKTHAANALEDLGFFCVDNLPTALLPRFVEFLREAGIERAALVTDMREPRFVTHFGQAFERLKRQRVKVSLVFLEASDSVLVRRFSETRRTHPLASNQPVRDALREEREALSRVRRLADLILDTSDFSVHELKDYVRDHFAGRTKKAALVLTLLSFGFKYGVPVEADLLFDVRFLKNPHFDPQLRRFTGQDAKIVKFMRADPLTTELLERVASLLQFLLPQYSAEGKAYLTVAIGCTGGRHRSVMMAEALAHSLRPDFENEVTIRVRHRDMNQA